LQAFARWTTDPAYQQPCENVLAPMGATALVLPRQGPAPSFEALAASVTRDVHPRSLLDDLVRLKLARWDEASDTVRVIADAFVPRDDWDRMLGYLGGNVGDHLHAAVDNVLGDRPQQMEQSIQAHGLSADSLADMRLQINAQWRQLTTSVVPHLQRLIEADEAQAEKAGTQPPQGRLRLGLYMMAEAVTPPGEDR
jgi:hypothetical protein